MRSHVIRIFAFLLITFSLSSCNESTVLDNLTQEQAVQVLAILQQHDIAASKSGTLKSGYSISVDKTETTSALSIIKEYQLPLPPAVQLSQAFPDSSMVSSPMAEKTRVLSLKEQRLEQSIRIIDQVVNARVNISYPVDQDNCSNKKESGHVSIIITYKGTLDGSTFIPEIKSLIKNSLDNIDFENISVVMFPGKNILYAQPTNQHTASNFGILSAIMAFIVCIGASGYYFYPRYKDRLFNRNKPETDSDEHEV